MEDSSKNLDLFKYMHSLQYERISKLESQSNYISTFVTGLSTITISISKDESFTLYNGLVLPLVFVIANLLAVLYINKTRVFIKMHQERAENMRVKYASEFQEIYYLVNRIDSNADKFRRNKIFNYLHFLIAFVGIAMIFQYIRNFIYS